MLVMPSPLMWVPLPPSLLLLLGLHVTLRTHPTSSSVGMYIWLLQDAVSHCTAPPSFAVLPLSHSQQLSAASASMIDTNGVCGTPTTGLKGSFSVSTPGGFTSTVS